MGLRVSDSPNLKSVSFSLPFMKWAWEFVRIRKPSARVFGLTSRTLDNRHILCLDYDMVDRRIVIGDVMMLKGIARPSLVFLLTTHEEKDELGVIGNYHVLILDKFYFREAEALMALTHADSIHRQLANKSRYRAWVIRVSEKGDRGCPTLVKVFRFKGDSKRETSLAHFLLLKGLYSFNVSLKGIKFDRFREIIMTNYSSASKLKVEEIFNKNG